MNAGDPFVAPVDPLRAEEVMHEALQTPLPGRIAVIEQLCGGDTALFDEVKSLLRHLPDPENPDDPDQPLGEVKAAVMALNSVQNLPPGISQTEIGDAEAMSELFASFGLAMLTGVLCIYIVLVLLFKDFVQPATILGALVLSIPGAFLALFITQTDISMPSMIGLIMLMGIATKNSILLIDYVIMARRDHGMPRFEAILDACHKRARPIVMTTIAMGAGMLPIAIGLGTDPSFRSPMAIVVIGGLITSTFLSLLVIPVLFTYVDDGIAALQRLLRRGKPAVPAAPVERLS
jgi:multidrug efflux pump subunit AcrB